MSSTLPCPCWETPTGVPGEYIPQRPPAIHPAPPLRLVCRAAELTARIREKHAPPTDSLATAAATFSLTPAN